MDSFIPFSLYGDPSIYWYCNWFMEGLVILFFFLCKVILLDGFIFFFFNASLSSSGSFKILNFLECLDLFIRLNNCKGGTFWLISLQIQLSLNPIFQTERQTEILYSSLALQTYKKAAGCKCVQLLLKYNSQGASVSWSLRKSHLCFITQTPHVYVYFSYSGHWGSCETSKDNGNIHSF